MEQLAVFLSLSSLLIWGFASLVAPDKGRTGFLGTALGLSLVQLGAAIWAAVRFFGGILEPEWARNWFRVAGGEIFQLKFVINGPTLVTWLVISLLLCGGAYFSLLRQVHAQGRQSRGELVAIPLTGFGAVLCTLAGNLLIYYFGWALMVPVGFLAIAFSAPAADRRAAASFRYLILNMIPDVLLMAGLVGIYSAAGSLDFNEVNSKASLGSLPNWPISLIIVAIMFRNMQVPFMQNARHLAAAGVSAIPVMFLGHAVIGATLFTKLYPAITVTPGTEYFSLLAVITALAASVLALAERDSVSFSALLVSYVSASFFLSGLAGHYQASQALAISGTLSAFLFALAISYLGPGKPGSHWVGIAGALLLTGLPIGGWGWARYLEYLGLLSPENRGLPGQGGIVGAKILADVLMAVGLWAITKDLWFARHRGPARARSQEALRWEIILPLVFFILVSLSLVLGGRPVGGMLGQAEIAESPASFLGWFERLLIVPGNPEHAGAIGLIGDDLDILARVMVLASLVVPALIALAWLFRDEDKLAEFRLTWSRWLGKLSYLKDGRTLLWDFVLRPATTWFGKAAAFFDARIVDHYLSGFWVRPARAVRDLFEIIERGILDTRLVDGLGQAIATFGRALRLFQNGQVQLYFALGVILLGVIMLKFIGLGG